MYYTAPVVLAIRFFSVDLGINGQHTTSGQTMDGRRGNMMSQPPIADNGGIKT